MSSKPTPAMESQEASATAVVEHQEPEATQHHNTEPALTEASPKKRDDSCKEYNFSF